MKHRIQEMHNVIVAFGLIILTGLPIHAWSEPRIVYLDLKAAREAIIDDSLEPYFATLQPLEMSAKTGSSIGEGTLDEQRAECRRRYRAGALEFTEEEKQALDWFVRKIDPHLTRHYPLMATMDWSFIKVTGAIEGGLPHTRGGHIIFSAPMMTIMVKLKTKEPASVAIERMGDLFLHEQFHVFQRAHRDLVADLYTGLMGFEYVARIDATQPLLTQYHLSNPDGVDCGWVFPIQDDGAIRRVIGPILGWVFPNREDDGAVRRVIWPLLLFNETTPGGASGQAAIKRMPGDIRKVAIELKKTDRGYRLALDEKSMPRLQNLSDVKAYTKSLPMNRGLYHPNEASASIFAAIVMFDAFDPPTPMPRKKKESFNSRFDPYRLWFRQHLR